ncbi:MAG: tandem-95 repeat protein, partial [Rubrivivax sp.]
VVVNLDGTWTYTPAADYNGSDQFTVLVSDGQGGTAMSTITIGVTAVNDAPVARPDQITLAEDTVVTFDPRANDSDVDGDPLTITQINGQPISFGQPVVLPEGTVSLNGNGTLNFTPGHDYTGSVTLAYTVSDGHGGQANGAVSLTVTPVDDVALVAAGSVSLSEEGLANGLADSNGAVDTTNSTTASGQLTLTDVDGGSVSLSLSGPSGLSSGGVAITWSGSGTAADPLVGTAAGHTVLTASIDGQGRYQVNLQAPVDHPDTTQEDVLGIALTVHADNGTATSTSTLTLQLEDDAPATGAQVQYVTSSTQDTNVMLVIDRSGSMNNALSDHTANGLKAALKGMLDHYGEVGDVRVQIVTFSDAAAGRSSWLTLSAAKTFIDTITANGGTNYDAALAAAQTAFQTPGKLAGAANVAYFLSDGQPTQGHEVDNAADRVNWEAFLQANHIDAYALGINGATSAMLPDLNPIAYDGSTGTERPAVILSSTADVKTYLDNSVSIIEHGNVSSLAGADGLQAVTAFSAAHQTASHFDATTHLLTLELSSGNRLVLNMATGEYTYTRHAGSLGDTFSYTVVDGDGDSGSGSLTLTRQNAAPEGTDATITLDEDTSHTFQLASFGFHDSDVGDRLTAVRIDTVPGDGQLLFKGQAVTAGQVILAQDVGALVFKPDANDNGTGYAQVTFSVRDQAGVFDATPNTLTFNVTPVNDASIAQVTNQGGTLLGLLDVSANPVLDLSRDQLVGVNDVDNNLTRIDITVRELLSVGGLANSLLALIGLGGDHSKLSLSTDYALTHGLLITGNDTRHITIESATPGGTVDVRQVNQLLSTLVYDPAELLGIQADLLPTMTLHATDAFGLTSSDSASAGLITANVNTVQQLLGTDDNQTLIGGDNTHDVVDAGRGNDVVLGGGGHDHLSGGVGDDVVSGGDGNDILFGNDGNDQLYGGKGSDALDGGLGADYLNGGAGSDFLTGGFGSDVFAWSFADKGTPTPLGRPVDTITDFDTAPRSSGGDMLDLRDLLSGESTLGGTGNLDQFLDFDTSSSPGSTIVHISSTGGFTNGTYTEGAEDQRVVLQNVDLRSDLGLGAASNDNQVIAELMNRGKLMVDSH